MTLKCVSCGKQSEEKTKEELFKEGWDFAPYFTIKNIVTCPTCPTAPLLDKDYCDICKVWGDHTRANCGDAPGN